MIEVGRVCLKVAGRDAGNVAVVVSKVNDRFVIIDGNVRRKRCNILHLEPTAKKLSIKENASTEEVLAAMKEAGLEVKKIPSKPKEKKEKPKKKRKS